MSIKKLRKNVEDVSKDVSEKAKAGAKDVSEKAKAGAKDISIKTETRLKNMIDEDLKKKAEERPRLGH